MSADETFLEAFIESSIGTIPNEIRRNLAHMRSLDQTYDSIIQELRECEEDYLSRAHDIIFNLPVESRQEPPKKKRKTSSGSADSNDGNNRQDSSEAKDEEMPGAIGSGNEEEDDSSDDDEKIEALSNPKEGIPVSVPIFKPASDSDDDDDDDTNEDMKSKTQLIIPTIEELRQQIQDPTALLRIAILRRDARQMVEEKKSNANQTFCIVDDAIKKLNSDIEKFETLLKTTGQYETAVPTGGALPNDLAAIQVTPNSQDWILAKVISHDAQTGMYNLSDEDIESNKTFTLPESQVVILGGVDRVNRGDVIYGVYPDTTSFYQATVVEMPKKVPGKDVLVLVHFKDDGDENGITHAKAVPMKHVMKVPYGAIQ